jgi:hypothetical protein
MADFADFIDFIRTNLLINPDNVDISQFYNLFYTKLYRTFKSVPELDTDVDVAAGVAGVQKKFKFSIQNELINDAWECFEKKAIDYFSEFYEIVKITRCEWNFVKKDRFTNIFASVNCMSHVNYITESVYLEILNFSAKVGLSNPVSGMKFKITRDIREILKISEHHFNLWLEYVKESKYCKLILLKYDPGELYIQIR